VARRLVWVIEDDLTPDAPADCAETVGWRGRWYRLDLTTAHAAELEAVLAPYVAAGTVVDSPGPSLTGRPVAGARERNKAMREWGAAHGIPAVRHGGGWRYPAALVEAFEKAHRPDVTIPDAPL
jgi:hypothetical protein